MPKHDLLFVRLFMLDIATMRWHYLSSLFGTKQLDSSGIGKESRGMPSCSPHALSCKAFDCGKSVTVNAPWNFNYVMFGFWLHQREFCSFLDCAQTVPSAHIRAVDEIV